MIFRNHGVFVLVIYDWLERENGSQYKLGLTKQQYDQMKTIVSPIGKFIYLLNR